MRRTAHDYIDMAQVYVDKYLYGCRVVWWCELLQPQALVTSMAWVFDLLEA